MAQPVKDYLTPGTSLSQEDENYFYQDNENDSGIHDALLAKNKSEYLLSMIDRALDLNKRGYINDAILKNLLEGEQDENTVTNEIFFWRHPDLVVNGVYTKLPGDKDNPLVKEWSAIFYRIVRPFFIWPPRPANLGMYSDADRLDVFGEFTYEPAPTAKEPRAIRLTGDWYKNNIVTVDIPQIIGKKNSDNQIIRKGKKEFHRLGATKITALWNAWETAGLLDRIITFEGSFVPRFITGNKSLSNHSWGTAFDINGDWNRRGTQPAFLGETGCTRELVSIANDNGFFWGGHFGGSSTDGMHFELGQKI